MSIDKLFTTPYHPQTDGLTERFNKTLAEMLTPYIDNNQANWDTLIEGVLYAYRTSEHSTTRETPFRMMYGRDPFFPLNRIFPTSLEEPYEPNEFTKRLHENFSDALKLAQVNAQTARAAQARNYNIGREPALYEVGQLVWFYNPKRIKGQVQKLSKLWTGPFVVKAQLSANVYRVTDLQGNNEFTVNIARIKPCEISLDEAKQMKLKGAQTNPMSSTIKRGKKPVAVEKTTEDLSLEQQYVLEQAEEQEEDSIFAPTAEPSAKQELLTTPVEPTELEQQAEEVMVAESRVAISPEEEVFPKVPAKVEPFFQALFRHYTTFRDLEAYKPSKMVTALQVFFDKPFVTSSKLREKLLEELKVAKKSRESLLRFLLECLKNFNVKFERAIQKIPDVPSINGRRM